MTHLKTLTLAAALAASPMIAHTQQNPQLQQVQAEPCKEVPKTPEIVNRQVVKQGIKWGSVFNRVLIKGTHGAVQPTDIPTPKPPQAKPCTTQPSTPAPPAPAPPAKAQ